MIYPYANVTERLPVEILKISPESIALAVSKAVWYKRLGPEVESLIPIQPTVPHEAVAVGKVTSASFNTLPDVPDAVANDTAVLAYEPPVTSVPEASSPGFEVHSDTYIVAGAVYVVAFRVAFKSAFSK
jgi:hypothetical protein